MTLLTSFLRKNCLNFEVVQLSDCPVVIDGADFLSFFRARIDFLEGDYLSFVLGLSKILKNIQKCKLEPIFVVDNDLEPKIFNDPSATSFRSSFLSMLQCADLAVLTPDVQVTCAAISLAAYLQCPLVASKSQYFLPVPKHGCKVPPPRFIPLDLLETTPVCLSPKVTTPCLLAYASHPDAGDLRYIQPSRYPVLNAFLCGISPLFTQEVTPAIFVGNSSEILTEEQLLLLIKWLANDHATSKQLVDELLSNCPCERKAEVSSELAHLFTSHLFNPNTIGRQLACQSGLTKDDTCDSYFLNGHSLISFDKSMIDSTYLGSILDGIVSHPSTVNITVGWPTRLTTAYRQAKFLNPLLKAPYNRDCIQLFDDASNFSHSVHSVTRPLRVACCRVLVSLEDSINMRHKLLGLQPNLIESVRCAGSLKVYRIPIHPLDFDLESESTDEIVLTLLDIPRSLDSSDPDWLVSMAVSLAVWYHKYPEQESRGKPPLDHCPLVLAVAASAVATVCNLDRLDDEMCLYYGRLIGLLRMEYNAAVLRLGTNSNAHYSLTSKQFMGLQRIYDYLRLLVSLVDSLFEETQRSKVFHFLPPWIIFPSSCLVLYLTALLELQIPFIRQDHVCYFWLPKMIRKHRSDSTQLSRATDFLIRLINLATALLAPSSTFLHPICLEDVSVDNLTLAISSTSVSRHSGPDSESSRAKSVAESEWGGKQSHRREPMTFSMRPVSLQTGRH
ncbi:hypothetical protein X801_05495 [Opisthorchis viverrini]|uniref:Asteroid domain-containing protein n=1 Tax=Opisthorchis viverrini TaxID=6198 RepID=A0A1S8WW21_OPIVI|nr:hypothetical protein X801_05495 [Opisthorchis viverrini]